MFRTFLESLLPRLLFLGTLAAALLLAGGVLILPWIESTGLELSPALDLFAQDSTVRRTALASAAGLSVTAFVFFRPRRAAKIRRPPPTDIAGA